MTTKEHLDKIVAKIDQLLELAEKRTQGGWVVSKGGDNPISMPGIEVCDSYNAIVDDYCNYEGGGVNGIENASYIAACAGPAEAGWRATKAAIEFAIWGDDQKLMEKIIAAWPEELL